VRVDRGWGPPGSPDGASPTDEINAALLADAQGMTFGQARLGLEDARSGLRAALVALPAPSVAAKEAFAESSVEHYEEHLPMLRRLTGSAGDVP
jgi:hypothetical protein